MDNAYNETDFVKFVKWLIDYTKKANPLLRIIKDELLVALVAPKKEEKEKELYWLDEHITVIEQSLYMCNQEDKNDTEEEKKGKAEYKERLLIQQKQAKEKLEKFYSNFEKEIDKQFNKAVDKLTAEEKEIAVKIWKEQIDFKAWLDEYLYIDKEFIFSHEDPINDN